jgi:outer membrane protein assembly factor BamB
MPDYNEQFTPEEINEQIKRFSSASPHTAQAGADPNRRLIQDLRRIYRNNDTEEDTRSLQRSWQRIVSAQNRSRQYVQPTFTERNHRMLLGSHNTLPQRSFGRRFAVLAAVLVAALLVGSTLLVLNHVAHSNQGLASPNTINQPQGALSQEVKTPSGVYVGGDNGIARIDTQTGHQIWKYSYPATTSPRTLSSEKIIAIGDTVYVSMRSSSDSVKPAVLAIAGQTGKLLWSHTFSDILEDLGTANNMLYVITKHQQEALKKQNDPHYQIPNPPPVTYTSTISVFDAVSGTQHASYHFSIGLQTFDITNGVLYASASDGLYAISLSNGQQLWHTAMSGVNLVINEPRIVNHVLYAAITHDSEIGNQSTSVVAAFKTSNGEKLWQSDNIQSQLSDITVANNKVFVGTIISVPHQDAFKGELRAYDANSGKLVWNTMVDGSVQWAPAVDNNQVYVSAYPSLSQPAEVAVLNIANGSIKWTAHVAAGIMTTPSVANGVVYVSTSTSSATEGTSTTAALKIANGSLAWKVTSSSITSAEALMAVD